MKEEKKGKGGEKGQRSLFGRILVFLLTIMAIIGLFAMALSVINGYINPKHFIWTTVFGLSFWIILFFNVLVFILLLLLWSKKVWISVLALLVAISGLNRSYSFGTQAEAESSIKIMSYNLHNFNHVDGKTSSEDLADQVMEMVKLKSPDILCCQEFKSYQRGTTRTRCIELFAQNCGFPYFYYNRKSNYGGNVVFSKFPVEKVTEDSGFGKEKTYGVMVSVDAGDRGKFYVANVHLLSYAITDDEIDILMSSSERQEKLDTIGKTVLRKLNYGFQRRSDELQRVLEGMPPVEDPVIVCGDFNEPPLSYNYNQMRKAGFVDTFIKAGHGIKPTYAGKLPLLRIDYFWASPEVVPLRFERYRHKASDHYPIILDFTLNQ